MKWRATHRDAVAQRGFTQIENVVLFDEELSAGARLLYAALKHFAWRNDGEIPPQVEVAKALGVSERALKTYASELREARLLTTQRRMAKPSLYVIEPPQINDSQSGNICPNDGADSAPTVGQDLPEKRSEDQKTKNPNGFFNVVDHWLELAPPLISHKREALAADSKLKTAVRAVGKEHALADVLAAISNYAAVISSPEHYFNHRWTLRLFLSQRNALPMFLPEADPLTNFQTRVVRSSGRDRGLTFDEILNGGSNEPSTQPSAALPVGL